MSQKPVIFLAFANDRVDDATYLRNLPRELDGIRNALQKAVKAGLCEVVERSNATIQNILDVFQDDYYKNRIAVFHYGGHANGYQLLLENLDGTHSSAHSEGLVSFLAKQDGLKLIFLNGCSSQQQAFDLVEAGIPAVIGTSQSINDDVAMNLAIRFYKSLAFGHALEKSWLESIDAVKIQKGTANMRDFFWEGMEEETPEAQVTVADRFPWEIHYKEGAELVKVWNLPEAVDNPLFGLPDLPKTNLPEQPYRFLERYTRGHSEIFFGRSYFIRELFNRATDGNSAPVILFYGQSGVGKSSMLDAGLFPRLEQVAQVIYVRRDPEKGLLGSILSGLGVELENYYKTREETEKEKIESQIKRLEVLKSEADDIELEQNFDKLITQLHAKKEASAQSEVDNLTNNKSLKQVWHEQETLSGQPLIVLLDQVEEIYTKPNPEMPDEIQMALGEVQRIFGNPLDRPKGKLILSYRKEYNPEIEEALKKLQIPREKIFLRKLERRDIEEVIRGLASNQRLQRTYELNVEQDLPTIIADDLLEDKDSPIAPVLQILLTKMWQLSENEELRYFSVKKYQELKRQGILMDDFFRDQMEKLKLHYPELIESGLALDVLYFHTTKMGTANAQSLEELRERYGERQDIIDRLVGDFKDLYLLADAGISTTGLAHDTLAPIVQEKFRLSDKPGQRAALILENKRVAYEQNPNTLLDLDDLKLVEEGHAGMRVWVKKEEELIEKSRANRDKILAERRRNKRLGILAILLILCTSIFASYKWIDANRQKDKAEIAEKHAVKEADKAKKAETSAKVAEEKALEAKGFADIKRREAEVAKVAAFNAQATTAIALADAKRDRSLAELAKDEALKAEGEAKVARTEAEEKELQSRRVALGVKAQKVAEANPMKGLRLAQLSYALNPDDVPASVQETLMEISLKADLDDAYSKFSGEAREPLYNEIPGFKGEMLAELELSKGGKYFAAQCVDSAVRVFNTSDASLRLTAKHKNKIRGMSFSGDDRYLATVSNDSTLQLWDLNTDTMLWRKDMTSTFQFVKIADDASRIMTGSTDKMLRIWDMKGNLLDSLETDNYPREAFFSPDMQSAYIRAYDHVLVWYLSDSDQNASYYFDKELLQLELSENGELILVRQKGNEAYAIDLTTDAVIPIRGHTADLINVRISPNNKYVGTASKDGTAKIWEINSYKEKASLITTLPHNNWVQSIQFVNGGERVLTASSDLTAKIWDLQGHLMSNMKGHRGDVFYAIMSKDNQKVFTYSADKTLKVWWQNRYFSRKVSPHKSFINGAKYSKDGNYIITAASDKTAIIWNKKGQAIKRLRGHTGSLYDATISPDSKWAATASNDDRVIIWALGSGSKAIATQTYQHKKNVSKVYFSPKSQFVTSFQQGGKAFIWDLDGTEWGSYGSKEEQVTGIEFSPDEESYMVYFNTGKTSFYTFDGDLKDKNRLIHSAGVLDVQFSRDGSKVASGSKDGYLNFWDLKTNQASSIQVHDGHWVKKIIFHSQESEYLTVGYNDAKRWSFKGELLATYTGHSEWIYDCGYLPLGKIYTLSGDETMKIWSTDGNLLKTIDFGEVPTKIDVSPQGTQMTVAGLDGSVKIWSLNSGKPIRTLNGHSGEVKDMVYSNDENNIITTGSDGFNNIWNINNNDMALSKTNHSYSTRNVITSPSLDFTASSAYGKVILWNKDGSEKMVIDGHGEAYINGMTVSSDGGFIYTAASNGQIGIWNLADKSKNIIIKEAHRRSVIDIDISKDGSKLLSTSYDSTVKIWDPNTGELLKELIKGNRAFREAEFSPNGRYILARTAKQVFLWSQSGELIAQFNNHKKDINTVRFSPDSQRIITSSLDGTAKIWDLKGKEISNLYGHTGYLSDATISADGKYAITSADDNTARVWLILDGKVELVAVLKGHTNDVVRAFYLGRQDLIATASLDGTARVWTTPKRIFNWLITWEIDNLTQKELLEFGFSQEEIDGFIDSGYFNY